MFRGKMKSFNIDIFQNKNFWKKFEIHNKIITDIYYAHKKEYVTNWFDPQYLDRNTSTNPWCRKSNKVGKFYIQDFLNPEDWNLILHPNNYLPIFLVNLLYQDRKDIVIEDVCSGMGKYVYYLSKLGFNDFSLFDNFSGVNRELLDNLMKDIKYKVNRHDIKPVVSNLSAYPWYTSPKIMGMPGLGGWDEGTDIPPKNNIPIDTCELFTFYCASNIFETIGKYLLDNGYVELCQDADFITVAYCKKERYKEFKGKIDFYEISN